MSAATAEAAFNPTSYGNSMRTNRQGAIVEAQIPDVPTGAFFAVLKRPALLIQDDVKRLTERLHDGKELRP